MFFCVGGALSFAFRAKFYMVWFIVESVNIASGISYNDKDANENVRWYFSCSSFSEQNLAHSKQLYYFEEIAADICNWRLKTSFLSTAPRRDRMTNVYPSYIEIPNNIQDQTRGWNIKVSDWLKYCMLFFLIVPRELWQCVLDFLFFREVVRICF